jgi:hypothetical protein
MSAPTTRMTRFRRVVVIVETLLAAVAALGGVLALAGLLPLPSDWAPLIALLGMAVVLLLLLLNVALRLLDGGLAALLTSSPFQRSLALAAWLVFVIVMGYGFARWPSAPVRPTAAGFTDKAGRHHSPDDYAAFKRWETALALFFLSSAVAGIAAFPPSPRADRGRSPEQASEAPHTA